MPIFGFTAPGGGDLAAMLFNGVLNGVGQYCWTRALTLAPPAAVGPFYYFSIVWALLLGFLIWGDVPTLALLAGSAIVVASGPGPALARGRPQASGETSKREDRGMSITIRRVVTGHDAKARPRC